MPPDPPVEEATDTREQDLPRRSHARRERARVRVRSHELRRVRQARRVATRGAGLADVTRSGAAPLQARGAEKVAEPRDSHGLHFTARVFRGLFGGDDAR